MPSDRSHEFEFRIQALVGEAITPRRRLGDAAETRLSVAKRTVDQNYYELDSYVDGSLPTNPMFICAMDRRKDEGFEVLRLVHTYLASVYSFNETVRTLFNRTTRANVELDSSDFTPASGGTGNSYYGRKLGFLRGLRTDFQHGGFSCLSFERVGELGDFAGYHVVFDRSAFVNESGVHEPNRFLRHTNESERRHPLCFLGQFHRNTLQAFHDDVEAWFEAA